MKDLIIILFGATGDLARRKLFPALYNLVAEKKIEQFFIVGAAHEETTVEEFVGRAKEFIPNLDRVVWKKLIQKN